MTSRLLMARVPEGASLVDNPTGGPQGFAMDNVYVMAGIPRVMQAMLSTLEGVIEHGSVVSSVSVRAYLGESQIATELGALQEQSPDVDIGSYPFSKDGRYGTVLVVRGTDPARLETVADAIRNLIIKAGETPENVDPS